MGLSLLHGFMIARGISTVNGRVLMFTKELKFVHKIYDFPAELPGFGVQRDQRTAGGQTQHTCFVAK